MKVKTLSALAGIGSAMILSSAANAAFTGLSISSASHVIGAADPGAGLFAGQTISTYQVYAVFNNAGDALTSVFGNDSAAPINGTPMTIETRNSTNTGAGGNFFNNAFGGNSAPNPALFAVSPSLQWDTYLTIGVEPGTTPDNTGYSPGFPSPFNGTSNNINIAWFNAVADANTTAGADLKVLLGQFSVANGENVRGTFGLTYRAAGAGADTTVQNNTFSTFAVPAPGALALLGLAGVVGSRRRRA
jgi:hypothetical protein